MRKMIVRPLMLTLMLTLAVRLYPGGKTETVGGNQESVVRESSATLEYFMHGLCGALHNSITFDNRGEMPVGSLGDNRSDVGQRGLKKIYRITSKKEMNVVAEVDCTYITALIADQDGVLYVACEQPNRILRISQKGIETVAEDGTYLFNIDGKGNLYYGSGGKNIKFHLPGERRFFRNPTVLGTSAQSTCTVTHTA